MDDNDTSVTISESAISKMLGRWLPCRRCNKDQIHNHQEFTTGAGHKDISTSTILTCKLCGTLYEAE